LFEGGAEAELFRQGEGGIQSFNPGGASGVGQGSGGDADAGEQAALQGPTLVQTEQNSGAEGVARAGRARDVIGGQFQGGLPDILAFARAGESTFGKMNDDQFANALLQQSASGMAQGHRIELPIGLANFETGCLTRFDFVQDAIIDMLEGGIDNFGEAIAILANDIDAGFDARRLGSRQQAGGAGAEGAIRLIERVQQEQIAEVKNAGACPGEIEIGPAPMGVGAASMEEGPAAMTLFGHDIGVGGRRLGSGGKVPDVDPMAAAIVEYLSSQGILTNQAGAKEREGSAGLGKIVQNIVGCAAGALGLAADVAQLLGLRVNIDDLDLIDDPVATGQEAVTRVLGFVFHGVRTRPLESTLARMVRRYQRSVWDSE